MWIEIRLYGQICTSLDFAETWEDFLFHGRSLPPWRPRTSHSTSKNLGRSEIFWTMIVAAMFKVQVLLPVLKHIPYFPSFDLLFLWGSVSEVFYGSSFAQLPFLGSSNPNSAQSYLATSDLGRFASTTRVVEASSQASIFLPRWLEEH